MPQGEHRVRLAATKVGLQVDHWRCIVITGQTSDGAADEVRETFGQIGTSEERHGIGVVRILFSTKGNFV